MTDNESKAEGNTVSSLIRHKLDAAKENALSLVERAVERRESLQGMTAMLFHCYETTLDSVFAAGESSLRSEVISRFEKEKYDAIQGQVVLDHASRDMWSGCESGRMELNELADSLNARDVKPEGGKFAWIKSILEPVFPCITKKDRARQSQLLREAGKEFITKAEEIILRKWNGAEEWFVSVVQQKDSSEEE